MNRGVLTRGGVTRKQQEVGSSALVSLLVKSDELPKVLYISPQKAHCKARVAV